MGNQSAEQACTGIASCDPTWAAVLTDQRLCPPSDRFSYDAFDCGDYHVLDAFEGGDTGTNYFYDATSGALVAILASGEFDNCLAGPPTGFTEPDDCTPSTLAPFPPRCIVDGGNDGGTD